MKAKNDHNAIMMKSLISLSGNTVLSVGHSHFGFFSFVFPKSNFTEAKQKQSQRKSVSSLNIWKLLFLV